MSDSKSDCAWYEADEYCVHEKLMDYVHAVEKDQQAIFDRFVKLEKLYDPNAPHIDAADIESDLYGGRKDFSKSSGNVIASNVDTVTASVSVVDIRARFITEDADWSEQRQAKYLEWYIDSLKRQYKVLEKAARSFKECSLKGAGMVKVVADRFNRPCIRLVLIDNIVVDDAMLRGGGADPLELHERIIGYDKNTLKAEYPDRAKEIDAAGHGSMFDAGHRARRVWSGRKLRDDELVLIESFRLPIGLPGDDGYMPGRHTICTDGVTLLDEEWDRPFFPYAKVSWSERTRSFYPISGAERIAPRQNIINKRQYQIDRIIDQDAFKTTYVHVADAAIAARSINRLGTIATYKVAPPTVVMGGAVHPEIYQDLDRNYQYAYREFGTSELDATSAKPAGLDSGRALREYRDATSQRHAPQHKAFEAHVLDILWLLVDVCKRLGSKAPVVNKRLKFKTKKIKWSEIDVDMVRTQIAAASTLGRTPAGKLQTATEWAQLGVISIDEWRRLSEHPDLERAMSIYTAALEDIERTIDEIEDGEVLIPEPYQNLKLGIWRMQQAYLHDRSIGAPEEILEAMQQWIVQAIALTEMGGMGAPSPDGMPAQDLVSSDMPGATQGAGLVEPPGVGAPMPEMQPQPMIG